MATIRNGVAAVNGRRYKEAYRYVSKPLRNKIGFGDFHDVIHRVKSIHVISIKMLRQTAELIEVKVIAEGMESDPQRRHWRKRKGAIILVFVPENGIWKVIQVDFHDLDKKRKIKS